MSNPSTETASLHSTQVRLEDLSLEAVHNFQRLTQGETPDIRLIETPVSWLTMGMAVVGLAVGWGYAGSKELIRFEVLSLILLSIISLPLLWLFAMGFRGFRDRLSSRLPPGLYLAKAHLLIVRRGVLTCLPRSRIRTMRTFSDRATIFLLDDGTEFDYEIVAYRAGPIGQWLEMAQGVDADWPPEIFGGARLAPERQAQEIPKPPPERYSPALLPEGQGMGSPPRRFQISSLPADRYQELRDLVRKKRHGIRIPYGISDHRYSFTIAVVLLLFPWIVAYDGDIPSVILVAGSVSLAILPILWMWKDIDFRYLSRLRPGVYLDSRHLFVVYPEDVIVVGLRGLRIGRDVQEVYAYSSGAEIELEAGGCSFSIWVATSNFVEVLHAHLHSVAAKAESDERDAAGQEDPWCGLASVQEDRVAAKRARIRRTAKAMVLIWLGFCLLNLFAGQAFGYWMQLRNYDSWKRKDYFHAVAEGTPEWFRSRLEDRVWIGLQRNSTIPELIRFLGWRGTVDHRADAQVQLRNTAQAALNQMRSSVDPRAQFQYAWLSQIAKTGEWRIGVSVRDSVASWPVALLEGMDRSGIVRDYDSAMLSAMGMVLGEEGCLTSPLPLQVLDPADNRIPLLFLESIPLDSTGASGESFRRWRVALPDGRSLMDLRLPVDAWQMSQLRLPPQESALGEYLRSAMRQNLNPRMDSAGKAWKESGQ
ncbi:MAG: hypothetical protein IPO40_15835 [Fibrobacteres bacterium]|nr:hypothetical protein [Fibrobacterota bacterium]